MNRKKIAYLALVGIVSGAVFTQAEASLEVAMAKRENREISYEDIASHREDRKRENHARNTRDTKEEKSSWKMHSKSQENEYEMNGKRKRKTD